MMAKLYILVHLAYDCYLLVIWSIESYYIPLHILALEFTCGGRNQEGIEVYVHTHVHTNMCTYACMHV